MCRSRACCADAEGAHPHRDTCEPRRVRPRGVGRSPWRTGASTRIDISRSDRTARSDSNDQEWVEQEYRAPKKTWQDSEVNDLSEVADSK